ncbi:MipA/OmpV family protein [Vibrio sp. ZSDZ34]|jgi:outer membrane protein|uniref:MipA/OmpV family protein n=2 Tax=Vibrio gelatinilyticus TaxID=2893468 RepID=A0A9X1W9V7_9VIBR|nr:MipA/OmpV family protein [Vibrio gelatinilyticus]MCJ2376668.1 MipA/OmpV family protein [Vibrio gelatinilyticus]
MFKNSHRHFAALGVTLCSFSPMANAAQEAEWGIAAVWRTASIPFETNSEDTTVSTFIPMMFFKNDYVFLDGTMAGAHLYKTDDKKIEFNAITRMRHIDVPKEEQNALGGDTADYGVQVRYNIDDTWHFDSELMTDTDYRKHANFRLQGMLDFGDLELRPNVTLRYKDDSFNSHYYGSYGSNPQDINGAFDASLGVDARYHLVSNLYLLGATNIRALDNAAYQSAAVKDRYEGEVFVGFGFFNEKPKSKSAPRREIGNTPYVRVAHGWASPSDMGDILTFKGKRDPYDNQVSSIFYGHPLTDELFGLPLDIYLSPGIAHHYKSEVQDAGTEFVALIKAYYEFTWPVQMRLGVGNGLSYIDNITYIEQQELDNKEKRPSHLMNYIDISYDINIGSLFRQDDLKELWLGYSLHHRSAIFEASSQFGRIKGGSNYSTVYLQYHF